MSPHPPLTPLAAMRQRRFLLSEWPWRSAAYLVTTPLVVLVTALPLCALLAPWIVLAIWVADDMYPQPLGTVLFLAVLGAILVVGLGPLVALAVAALEHQRIRLVHPGPVRSARQPPPASGFGTWLRARYTDPATWKAFAYTGLLTVVAPVTDFLAAILVFVIVVMLLSPWMVASGEGAIALGFSRITSVEQAVPYAMAGLVLLPAIPYTAALVAGVHASIARALLLDSDPDELRAQLVEVERSRARLVDAFEAERRRIERDLHDGAQALLLNLTLQLGLARLELPEGSAASNSVTQAHEQAKQLMTELRQLIRGIHPRVLTDRGLPDALRELAEDVAVPVHVSANLPQRPPHHVEVAAYFVVVEALNNVTKHAAATEISVAAHDLGNELIVEVVDNGCGGADPARGGGLTGLADRVAVVDGRMLLSSPPGGPTVVRVELPCSRN